MVAEHDTRQALGPKRHQRFLDFETSPTSSAQISGVAGPVSTLVAPSPATEDRTAELAKRVGFADFDEETFLPLLMCPDSATQGREALSKAIDIGKDEGRDWEWWEHALRLLEHLKLHLSVEAWWASKNPDTLYREKHLEEQARQLELISQRYTEKRNIRREDPMIGM
jgi:hypothetical protein